MALIQPFQFEPEYPTDEENDESYSLSQESGEHGPDDEERASRVGDRSWCQCGNCIPMPTEQESMCCQELSFLSQTVGGMLNCSYEVKRSLWFSGKPGLSLLAARVVKTSHQAKNYSVTARYCLGGQRQ